MTLSLTRAQPFALSTSQGVRKFRAMFFSVPCGAWWCMPLKEKGTALPKAFTLDFLSAASEAKHLTLLSGTTEDPRIRRGLPDLSEAERLRWQGRLRVVASLLVNEEQLVYRDHRGAIFRQLTADLAVSHVHIRTIWRCFWYFGAEPMAVLPSLAARGGRGVQRLSSSAAKHVLTREDAEWMDALARSYYSTDADRPESVQAAYKLLLAKYADVERNDLGLPVAGEFCPHPSLYQFRRRVAWIGKTPADQSQRVSPKRIGTENRSRTGRAAYRVSSPCATLETDSWVMSEFGVFSELMPEIELPTPRLFLTRDQASSVITGRYLDITGETSESALTALYYAFTARRESRPELIATMGFERFAGEPLCLRGDGLVRRVRFEELNEARGITIEAAPVARGDMKPLVESSFNRLLGYIRGKMPRELTDSARKNGHERSDGRISLRYLLNIVDLAIERINCSAVRWKQIQAGVLLPHARRPTASELFALLERQCGSVRRFLDADVAIIAYLPRRWGEVQETGILLEGLLYECQTAKLEGWFMRGFHGRPERVICYIDPADCARAWIYWPDGSLEPLKLVDGREDLLGVRRSEFAIIAALRDEQEPSIAQAQQHGDSLFQIQKEALITHGAQMLAGKIAKPTPAPRLPAPALPARATPVRDELADRAERRWYDNS